MSGLPAPRERPREDPAKQVDAPPARLPLVSPALIFGARAAVLALDAESAAGPLYFNASLAILAVSLGPVAIAAALRAGLE